MSTTPQGPSGPEYLESSAGSPVAGTTGSSDSRKRVIVLGGILGLLAVGGGAAWAASSFLSTGDQPAQALPASTIAYASVDLDPSGEQKIEAIRTLRKFPAFADNVDLDTDDDLRERLFTELTESGECEGLDYAADVEPWMGDRAAVAAVDTGAETPSPVLVLQVSDAGAAEDGLATLQETCGGDEVDSDHRRLDRRGRLGRDRRDRRDHRPGRRRRRRRDAGRRRRLPALDRGGRRPRHREHVRRPGRRAVPRATCPASTASRSAR